MKILVIEDIGTAALGVKTILVNAGHDVEIAADAPSARRLVGGQDYDCIFVDFSLPGTLASDNGLALAAWLRQSGFDKPLLALTADKKTYSIDAMKRAGLNACIEKPFSKKYLHLLTLDPKKQYFSPEDLEPRLQVKEKAATRIVDFDEAINLVGSRDAAISLFDAFFNDLPNYFLSLDEAFKSRNIEMLKNITRDIKGEAAYAGIPAVKKAIDNYTKVLKVDSANIEREHNVLISALYDFMRIYPSLKENPKN